MRSFSPFIPLRGVLATCLLLSSAESPAVPNEVKQSADSAQSLQLVIDLDTRKTFSKDVYGTNFEPVTSRVWFDHPALSKKYIEAGSPFFRFPGGTPSNYYNNETGFVELDPRSAKAEAFTWINPMIKRHTGGTGRDDEDFYAFVRQNKVAYTFVLNVCTRTPEQNRAYLAKVAAKGHQISRFEIGNEVFFNNTKWVFPTPESYVTRARQETETIRDLFPEAEIGVVISHQPYQDGRFFTDECPNHMLHQRGWIEALQAEDFYDAIIIHPYTPTGMAWETKPEDFISHLEGYSNVTDHLESHLDPTFDTLETRFPGKDIWVSEYGVGGFGGTFNDYKLRSTHLGALHADLMLLRFLQRDSVTVAHWHSFSHFWDFVGGERGISDAEHLTYAHFRLFDDPIRKNEAVVPIKFTPRNSEVEAVALVGPSGGHILLINKRGNTISLDKVTASQSGETIMPALCGVVQLTHRSDLPLENASYDLERSERVELAGGNKSSIQLPPYSFTRIEFSIDE